MRNRQLHGALSAFAEEAAWQLASLTADGAEVPFEVVAAGRRDAPLYCYRPLTGDFIAQRVSLFGRLPSYVPAVGALAGCGGLDAYLQAHGERTPRDGRERADAALRVFLARVFEDSTDFELAPDRLEGAYAELEDVLYDGRTETVVIAPLLGIEVESPHVALGDGLALVPGDAFEEGAPSEALWAPGAARPHLLAVLRWEAAAGDAAPVGHARVRLRRLLTALRLYEAGSYAFGPLAWTRSAGGTWQPFALGALAPRVGDGVLLVPADAEDELRAFCSLIARRTPHRGEIAWALRRYEMGCERSVPGEALSDHLLALRALLEPEGAESGRLSRRVAALCATPDGRAALAARVARAAALERSIVTGLAHDPAADDLVGEVAGHLRALLRDVLCGHLDAGLRGVADEILAAEPAPAPAPASA